MFKRKKRYNLHGLSYERSTLKKAQDEYVTWLEWEESFSLMKR